MPSFENLLNYLFPGRKYKNAQSTETVRDHLHFIQKIGKLPINITNLEKNITQVITYMKQYPDVLSIQRACCHTISNVAMEIEPSVMLMTMHAHTQVIKTLHRMYKKDWKICWLGCSALWNLARPETCRKSFTPADADLALDILNHYKDNERVVNTAVGCLSNLCLDHGLKRYVGTRKNITRLLQTIQDNVTDTAIASTGAGLVANLAVNDEIANSLVECNCIYLLTQIAGIAADGDNTFQRNTAAALSNITTSPNFLTDCLRNNTVEALFQLQESAHTMGVIALIMNCFNILDVDSDNWTTSYHMMCHHGLFDILKQELFAWEHSKDDTELFNIDITDSRGATMIIYGAAANNPAIVGLLIKFQAEYDFLHSQHLFPECEQAICLAEEEISIAKKTYKLVLAKAGEDLFPGVLSNIIISYLPYSTLLLGVGLLD